MSWSLSGQNLPREDAKHLIRKLFEAQPAYHDDAFNQAQMDEAARYAGKVSDSAPQGTVIAISAYGHSNRDGTGNIGASISISRPAPAPEVEAKSEADLDTTLEVIKPIEETAVKPTHPHPDDDKLPSETEQELEKQSAALPADQS